jgi:glycosyltransferase involved in cell wall biosynthesis
MLSPESPYPLQGGGAYRTASLLRYFARFADVDLILMSDSGNAALLPPGLVQSQYVIPLPVHSRAPAARYLRNARRAVAGIPPLIDRLSGLESDVDRTIAHRHYDIGIIEHFWCAPYVQQLGKVCGLTILDLHNVESVLHERCAVFSRGLVKAGHRRFATVARGLESTLLPRFSMVLAASEPDAQTVRQIAPEADVEVYPNSFPSVEIPRQTEQPVIVFSANFEYHPNIDAVQFLTRDIWPEVRRRHPELRLRLVGRGDSFIRHLLPGDPASHGIETTGPVADALAEIARARIVVAPLRVGSGTRIKIIEAWAAARPVIATGLAAEGLETCDGADILLTSHTNAGEFIEAIDRVLADDSLRHSLGRKGRQTFESRYSWSAAWAILDRYPQLTRHSGLSRYTGNS